MARLDELEALLEAATPGPWQTGRCRKGWTVDGLVVVRTVLADLTALNDEANAAVIVAAVNALPALIAVARAGRDILPLLDGIQRAGLWGTGDEARANGFRAALDRLNEEGAG